MTRIGSVLVKTSLIQSVYVIDSTIRIWMIGVSERIESEFDDEEIAYKEFESLCKKLEALT